MEDGRVKAPEVEIVELGDDDAPDIADSDGEEDDDPTLDTGVPDLIDTDDEDDEAGDDGQANLGASNAPNGRPKWRAQLYISVGRRSIAALADSGCSISCISYDFYKKIPALQKLFVPVKSSGRTINGSDVPAVGEVILEFWVEGYQMATPCKVIEGLVNPVVLGWDFMAEKGICLDAGKGLVHFEIPAVFSAPLILDPLSKAGHFYRVAEDVTLPPNSKILLDVELVTNDPSKVTSTAVTEPFEISNGTRFWAARTCSTVEDNRFKTEFINCSDNSVKVEAGYVVGSVEFLEDESKSALFCTTRMTMTLRNQRPTSQMARGHPSRGLMRKVRLKKTLVIPDPP